MQVLQTSTINQVAPTAERVRPLHMALTFLKLGTIGFGGGMAVILAGLTGVALRLGEAQTGPSGGLGPTPRALAGLAPAAFGASAGAGAVVAASGGGAVPLSTIGWVFLKVGFVFFGGGFVLIPVRRVDTAPC